MDIGNKKYMLSDLSKEIYTKEWGKYFVFPIVSNLVYCILFPILLTIVLLATFRLKRIKLQDYERNVQHRRKEYQEKKRLKDQTEEDNTLPEHNDLVKESELEQLYLSEESSFVDMTFMMKEFSRLTFWYPAVRVVELSIQVALAAGLGTPTRVYYKAMAMCIAATVFWFLDYVVDPFVVAAYPYHTPKICLIFATLLYMASTADEAPALKWPFDIFIAIIVIAGFIPIVYTLIFTIRSKIKRKVDSDDEEQTPNRSRFMPSLLPRDNSSTELLDKYDFKN
jgi:hypothetical protein